MSGACICILGWRSLLVEGISASLGWASLVFAQSIDELGAMPGAFYSRPALFLLVAEGNHATQQSVCEQLARVRSRFPDTKAIVVASNAVEDDEALVASGADGCLRGNFTAAEFKTIISVMLSADKSITVKSGPSGALAQQPTCLAVPAGPSEQVAVEKPYASRPVLSLREHEILAGLTGGSANKTLARQLEISEATVKAHVRSLFRKLSVHSRAQAVKYILDHCPQGTSIDEYLATMKMQSSRAAFGPVRNGARSAVGRG